MLLEVLPSGISINKNGQLQFVLSAVSGCTADFPANLIPCLNAFNDTVTNSNQAPLTRSMLPEIVSQNATSARGRKCARMKMHTGFFIWSICDYTPKQVQLAIPVLLEWFCGHQKHQREFYDFLTEQQQTRFGRVGRNIRLMMLLQLVYETAINEKNSRPIAEKMCQQIQSKFLLGEIVTSGNEEHMIIGWYCMHDTKRQHLRVLPTL